MNLICVSRITAQHSVKGGMENHLAALAEGLVAKSHTVTVVTTGRRDSDIREETINGVRYVYTDSPPEVYSAQWNREAALTIHTLHAEQKIDLAWAEGGGAFGVVSALQQLGIPYIPIAQGTIPGDIFSYARQIKSPLDVAKFVYISIKKLYLLLRYELRYLRSAARVVAVSDELKEDMQRYYGLPKSHVEVIYNGVPEERFYPSKQLRHDTRTQLGIPQDAVVLLGMGRLIREKGFHLLVEAFSTIHHDNENVYLIIAGKGEFEDELRAMITRLELESRVVMAGFVAHHDTIKYYNASDMFVSPTLRAEGLPLTFCEAMLCGLPIVASALGGNPSAVKDGETGLLLKQVSSSEVVEKVGRLLEDRGFLVQLGKQAHGFAKEHFTQEVMVERTEKVFEEMVENEK